MSKRQLALTWLMLSVIGCLALGIACTCHAQGPSSLEPTSPAEVWVLQKVAAGEVADLATIFPNAADRALRSAFLQSLITSARSDTHVPRHGVRIISAVITDTLDLRNAEIPYEIWLVRCRFDGLVDLAESSFARNLDLSESSFRQTSNFHGLRVGSTMTAKAAIFAGLVDFGSASIGRELSLDGAQFNNENGADFLHIKVGTTLSMKGAAFAGPVNLTAADVGLEFAADGAQFKDSVYGVSMRNLHTGDTLSLTKALFSGPVTLAKARIDGSLNANEAKFQTFNFSNAHIAGTAVLDRADFTGSVSFVDATIEGGLTASRAHFHDQQLATSFHAARINGHALFGGAVFDGKADFSRASVALDFQMSEAQFNDPDADILFTAMRVGGFASLAKAIFAGGADFSYLDVALDFNVEGAQFLSADHSVIFAEAKIGGNVYLFQTSFSGPTLFSRMTVNRELVAFGVKFTGVHKDVSFDNIKVGGNAAFGQSIFAGSANFSYAEAPGLQLDEAEFTDAEATVNLGDIRTGYLLLLNASFAGRVDFIGANLSGDLLGDRAVFHATKTGPVFVAMTVGGSVFFRKATFAGPVDFHQCRMGGNLEIDETQFKYTEKVANFGNLKVGGLASLKGTEFASPAYFVGANINGQLIADRARFMSNYSATFDGAIVGDSAFFRNATFAGPLSLADATFLDLSLAGVVGDPLVLPRLDMSRAILKRGLALENVRLNELFASGVDVSGPTTFVRVAVEHEANLEGATFQSLSLSDTTWPTDTNAVRLDGITYKNINAGSPRESWQKLLAWVDRSAYSANVYADLENYFRQRGYPEQADEIFIAQRRRERSEVLGGPISLNWWWNLFLDGFVRFGRSPDRAFAWSAFFILIGCLVFRQRNMEQKDNVDTHNYNAFWYSLDLFVPVLDLQTANHWMPKKENWFARHYMRFHAILGWLLIPIGLAALTGLIK